MDELFTAVEAAAILKISRRAFDRLALPRYYMTGSKRSPRWSRATLEAHLASVAVVPPRSAPVSLQAPKLPRMIEQPTFREQLAARRRSSKGAGRKGSV